MTERMSVCLRRVVGYSIGRLCDDSCTVRCSTTTALATVAAEPTKISREEQLSCHRFYHEIIVSCGLRRDKCVLVSPHFKRPSLCNTAISEKLHDQYNGGCTSSAFGMRPVSRFVLPTEHLLRAYKGRNTPVFTIMDHFRLPPRTP